MCDTAAELPGYNYLRGCHLLAGVWDVSNVLEASFQKGDFEPHTLSIEVEDVPGVLNQVSSADYAVSIHCNAFLLQLWSQQQHMQELSDCTPCSAARTCCTAHLHSCTGVTERVKQQCRNVLQCKMVPGMRR